MPSRAGSPNKNKQALIKLLELKYPGYNPILEMAAIATDEENDLHTRFTAHKEIAQYIVPKLKAVEHSGNVDVSDKTLSKNEIKQYVKAWKRKNKKDDLDG